MHRRTLLGWTFTAATRLLWRPACGRAEAPPLDTPSRAGQGKPITPLDVNRRVWRDLPAPDRYRALFAEATEPVWSSPLDQEKRDGTGACTVCHLPVVVSVDKCDSGTGWPRFTRPLPGRVGTKADCKLVWLRTEYRWIRCGGHQGRVFRDGPPSTGQRWCNHGLVLAFVPEGEERPALRGGS